MNNEDTLSKWNLEKIKADRRAALDLLLIGADRGDIVDRLVEAETNLYVMTYAWSELDMIPGHRCSAWATSNLFPCFDDDDKALTIEKAEPRAEYRAVPSEEKWHETAFSKSESLSIRDGTKIHDDFELLAVHQNAPGAYIGCGHITMGDVRRAAALLWPRGDRQQ